MQRIFLVLLLVICTVFARPSSEGQYLSPADYRLLNDALLIDQEIAREMYRRLNAEPKSRLRRRANALETKSKRVRIGGNIVMGRKK
ncbi:unnamed protein product [Cylicocyclus nassatus]|uniref:Uncharacterized protein n=1 Tax=Cylicocyclus nassatus TaxID=53992 RepID=A0AA36DPS6_CYLNA|nr:unnamed protein product [Cylicocyclus nassatus]